MDSEKRTVIHLRLKKAHEDLITAQDLLASSHFRAAVNRAYYVNFHAVSAVLYWLDIERRKHSGIEAAFNQKLIKPGLIEVEYGRFYQETREWREEQDYRIDARPLNRAMAERFVNGARDFIERMEKYLRDVGAIA